MIPSVPLNDGRSIPLLGYGVGTAWYKGPNDPNGREVDRQLVEAIKMAMRLGYRHFDAAEVYGTEAELGTAIKESGIPREELWVTTKVLGGFKDIPKALETSLARLGLDYVDLYLIHFPTLAKSDEELQAAWRSMESLQSAGKARSIGVSNFLEQDLRVVLSTARVVPAVNQLEHHPYLQRTGVHALMKEKGIRGESYGPLTPITRVKEGERPVDKVIEEVAGKYGVSTGCVLLRWCMELGVVPVSTSGKEERLKEYLKAPELRLTEEEVRRISEEGAKREFQAYSLNLGDHGLA